MRYIQKLESPQFFIDDTNALSIWDDYLASNKRKLKQYILEKTLFPKFRKHKQKLNNYIFALKMHK